MRAVILAAGRGSRLHPYTAECPKCLTELGGRSLIDRQLEVLRGEGVDDLVIVTGFCPERLGLPGTTQVHNPGWKSTNMVESLFCAEQEFGDALIVSYSDIIYEPRILKALLNSEAPIAVTVDRKWREYWEWRFENPLADAESLKMDRNGHIRDIGQVVEDIHDIQAQYMGLMCFKGQGVSVLKSAYEHMQTADRSWKTSRPVEKAYMTDLLMEMVLMGHEVSCVCVDGGWLEVDTVEEFERLQELFASGQITRFYDPSSGSGIEP